MNNLINKVTKFMHNRYGIDDLYSFLLIICLIVILLNSFIKSIILDLIELTVFTISIYRVLSKNRIRRSKENQKYLSIKEQIIKKYNFIKKRYNDRNTHMYKKCPKCKQKIRLPLKKGKHTVKCPNCNNKFEVRCKKNEKIKVEIVK